MRLPVLKTYQGATPPFWSPRMRPFPLVSAIVLLLLAPVLAQAQAKPGRLRTRNVVLVLNSRMRWQEVFRGADSDLINSKDGGVEEPEKLRRVFDGETETVAAK
ncbi:MAG: hypothetical protein U0790_16185 [Isosphaeraceae bacterium]